MSGEVVSASWGRWTHVAAPDGEAEATAPAEEQNSGGTCFSQLNREESNGVGNHSELEGWCGGNSGGSARGAGWTEGREGGVAEGEMGFIRGSEKFRSASFCRPHVFLLFNSPPAADLFPLQPRLPDHPRRRVTMLEAFEILSTSGVVLWSRSYAPVGAHVVNSLINDVFIEEKVQLQAVNNAYPIYKKEKYTLKWKRAKDFNLIFVVRWKLPFSRTILTHG